MRYKIGDTVLLVSDLDSPNTIREAVVTKVGKDSIQCGSSEETYYTAFVWPQKYKTELIAVMEQRAALKKAYDDSMSLVYQLKNKISREESC